MHALDVDTWGLSVREELTSSKLRLAVHATQTMPLRLGCQSTAGKHLFLL